MPKDRQFTIPLPHFNYDVKVVFTDDFKAFALKRKWTKFHEQIRDDGRTVNGYHCSNPEESTSWILLKHDPAIGTIVHETFHVVWRIMKHIGADLENEVMAYHNGYIVKKITDHLYHFDDAYQDMREFTKKKVLTPESTAAIL
jgi:hypothetical protein